VAAICRKSLGWTPGAIEPIVGALASVAVCGLPSSNALRKSDNAISLASEGDEREYRGVSSGRRLPHRREGRTLVDDGETDTPRQGLDAGKLAGTSIGDDRANAAAFAPVQTP
jgi:hypothetical protein